MDTYSQDGILLKNIVTPYGRLYQPLSTSWQLSVVSVTVGAGILLGWIAGNIPGDLTNTARAVIYAPLIMIFYLGYSQWNTKCSIITQNKRTNSLLAVLSQILTRSQRPKTVEDVLPPQEKFVELMVRAQQAGSSFRIISLSVGMISGWIAMFFSSSMHAIHLFALITLTCILWGNALTFLARRCYLPLPEQS